MSPLFLRRTRWKLIDKLRVADCAIESGWIKRTARLEGTSPTNVRRWIAQRDELVKQVQDLRSAKITQRYRMTDGLGRAALLFGPDVDRQLYEYYRHLRDNQAPVSCRLLIAKWKLLDPVAMSGISVRT